MFIVKEVPEPDILLLFRRFQETFFPGIFPRFFRVAGIRRNFASQLAACIPEQECVIRENNVVSRNKRNDAPRLPTIVPASSRTLPCENTLPSTTAPFSG
jgi:hypothetical protein